MKTSARGLAEIAVSEALVPAPYLDAVNVWTWGIGHTAKAGPPDPVTMPRGLPDDIDAAIRRAVRLFQQDIGKYEARVASAVRVPLAQHEFDALVSFDFNTGGIASSSGTPRLNAGDKAGAWAVYETWNKGTVAGRKVTLDALVRRRADERRMFFNASYAGRLVPVWRVTAQHRPVYGNPIKMLSPANFDQLLSVTAIERPVLVPPPVGRKAESWFSRFIASLFARGLKPPMFSVGLAVDHTSNGLPIYAHASDFPNWRWANFRPVELACKGTGRLALDPASMDKLQALREAVGRPLLITSGYRSPEHNRAVGGAPASKHMQGIAFDVQMAGLNRATFKSHAKRLGFNGIGEYANFIHIDTRSERARW